MLYALTVLVIAALFALGVRVMFDWDSYREYMTDKKKDDEPPPFYMEVELSGPHLRALFSFLRGPRPGGVTDVDVAELTEQLRNGRRHEGEVLPSEKLPWAKLEAEAERQGCSVEDVLYDWSGGREIV